uniref:Uncharacterized protein n=1 Tax=Rhizophora mucronata TaxID=61149 RepID=A0A2P2ILU8_RHIMU
MNFIHQSIYDTKCKDKRLRKGNIHFEISSTLGKVEIEIRTSCEISTSFDWKNLPHTLIQLCCKVIMTIII